MKLTTLLLLGVTLSGCATTATQPRPEPVHPRCRPLLLADGAPCEAPARRTTIAVGVAPGALVSSGARVGYLDVSLGGWHDQVSWQIDAGVTHALDEAEAGLSLGAAVAFSMWRRGWLQAILGGHFYNLSSFYDGAPERPRHYIHGEAGLAWMLFRTDGLALRLVTVASLGAKRRLVARFDGAREVIDEAWSGDYGAVVRLEAWVF